MLSATQHAWLQRIEAATPEQFDATWMHQLHGLIAATDDDAELARIEAAADHLAGLMLAQMQALLGDFELDLDTWHTDQPPKQP